jgi:serine/threonine protein kinase
MPVAVKVFDRQTAVFAGSAPDETSHKEQQRDIMCEINVLTKLRHPNICLYMGMCMTTDRICIVSELYCGGSVHEFLHGVKPRRFSPCQALDMISDVAQAMVYLHSKPHVLHRDLKASNILVNASVTHCVVCDFGLSRVVKDTSGKVEAVSAPRHGTVGTPYTMAPEVIRGERYTRASDVYSFGIVAWEIWTGELPFEGLKPMQIVRLEIRCHLFYQFSFALVGLVLDW